MSEQRPYRRIFRKSPDSYRASSRYDNRSYSRDRGNFYDQERDNSFNPVRKYSFDRDRGYAKNQDEKTVSTRSRMYSVRNEKSNHSFNRSKQYSTQGNSGYRSHKKTYGSTSSNSNMHEERPYFHDQVDDFSHSVTQSREYPRDKDGDNYSNRSRQSSIQDHSGYRSNHKTYGSLPSTSNMHEERSYCQDQVDDLYNSVRQSREYSLNKDGDNYSNRSGQFSSQDHSGFRSNHKTYGSSSPSNSNMHDERSYFQDEVDDFSHSVRQSREYSPDKDGDNYSNRSGQYSIQDNSGYRYNQKTNESSSNSNKHEKRSYNQDQVDDDLYNSVRQSREHSVDNDWDNYSNRSGQCSIQENSGYRSNQQPYRSSSSNSNLYTERSYCQDQVDDFSRPVRQSREHSLDKDEDNYSNKSNYIQDNSIYRSNKKTPSLLISINNICKEQPFCGDPAVEFSNSENREYSLNNDGESYSSKSRQYSSQDNFDFRSNENPYSSQAAKNSTCKEQTNIDSRDINVSQQPQFSRFTLGNPQIEEIQNLQLREHSAKFGYMKRKRQPNFNETFSDVNTSKHFKTEQNYEEYNTGEIKSHNEIKVPADVINEVKMEEEEDDYDDFCNEDICNKLNSFIPDKEIIEKYKYFPPSAEEMGKIFKGLVIFFLYKTKDVPEKNPFVVICESFRRSDRFDPLSVEDGYQTGNKFTKFCTLRWHGMMLVRGVGYTGKFKEPRVVAGVELINQLAMSCYTLKMKDCHYGKAALDNFLSGNNPSNIMRIVQSQEAHDMDSACTFITNFFNDDNDCELLFMNIDYLLFLKSWAKDKGYDVRSSPKQNVLGISVRRTPQSWRDRILASGKMENDKFILLPPQGYGNELMKMPIFSDYQGGDPSANGPSTMYAHNNAGLKISTCTAPWRKRGANRRSKNNRKKKIINQAVKEGDKWKIQQKVTFVRKKFKKNKRKMKKRLCLK